MVISGFQNLCSSLSNCWPKPKPESKITGEEESDRISDLPDPILEHIFSYLDAKQAVQASVLGTRWRYLWASLPVLNFDHNVWKKKNRDMMYVHFVDQVFKLRFNNNNNSPIQRFSISYDFCSPESRIQSWISAATDSGVEEIHLQPWHRTSLVLPDCIFTSNTIRVFKFRPIGGNIGCFRVLTPTMYSSLRLKILELHHTEFPRGDSSGEIKFSCPVLESLSLTACGFGSNIEILSICTPLLEYLVIDHNIYGYKDFELKICSPKLKSFKCKNSAYKDLSIDKSADSFSAEIDFDHAYNYYNPPKQYRAQRMIALLEGLWMANSLTVTESSLRVFVKFPALLDALPADHFHMLKYFRLKRDTLTSIPQLNLFKIFRGVETLVVEVGECFGIGIPSRLNYTFAHLKYVELRYLQGRETELQFLKFFLENSMLLEKITITTAMRNEGGELTVFKDKILTLAGAYCHIIYFEEE